MLVTIYLGFSAHATVFAFTKDETPTGCIGLQDEDSMPMPCVGDISMLCVYFKNKYLIFSP